MCRASAAQRRRERRAEESRAEAEATVEQIRRHHRSIGSLFSRGAATSPSPPTPKVWRQLEHRERRKGDMRLAR